MRGDPAIETPDFLQSPSPSLPYVPANRRFTSPRGRKLTGLAKKYPRLAPAEVDDATALHAIDIASAPPRSILVTERSSDHAATTAFIFARAGYRVSTAANVAETMQALARERFDLVLIGATLGSASAVALLRTIRTRLEAPAFRTNSGFVRIVVTLDGDRGESGATRYRALASGADDVLVNPVDARELLMRVHVLLRRAERSSEQRVERFELGCLSVDFAAHQVTVDGQRVTLTRTEFTLLRTLVEQHGHLCTRETLNAIRNTGATPRSGRGIDMQISRMRRKLGAAGRFIENVRGAGYRLHVTPPARDP